MGNKYSVWFLKTQVLKSSVKGILITLTVFLHVETNYFTKTDSIGITKH